MLLMPSQPRIASRRHDPAAIVQAVLDGYALPVRGFHGVEHWARVHANGARLAESTGADAEVVALFALFHDARRVNEHHDPGHGTRGGDLAHALRGTLVHLDDRRFELLYEACRLHTDGHRDADPTLQACWDADRLDLGRVGIVPRPVLLCTDAARALLAWAHERAEAGHIEAALLRAWGIPAAD
jgi:uncharacterized protein